MSTSDYDDDDGYYYEEDYTYYEPNEDEFIDIYLENSIEKQKKNIEYFEYECITLNDAKCYFQSIIESLCSKIQVICLIFYIICLNCLNRFFFILGFEINSKISFD